MWPVSGKNVNIDRFKPFQPWRILYDFDGPKTFVSLDQDGELLLAHWCDEDNATVRYLVVPFSMKFLQRLEIGQMTLREAIDQPRLWVVDMDQDGHLQAAWRTELAELPEEVLPKPGTLLLPALQKQNIQSASS